MQCRARLRSFRAVTATQATRQDMPPNASHTHLTDTDELECHTPSITDDTEQMSSKRLTTQGNVKSDAPGRRVVDIEVTSA